MIEILYFVASLEVLLNLPPIVGNDGRYGGIRKGLSACHAAGWWKSVEGIMGSVDREGRVSNGR